VRGHSGLRIGARRSGGEAVRGGMPRCPFIGLEGEWGSWAMEGNGQRQWCAIMVVEAAVSRGDRPGWWGVMRGGGASAILGAEGGCREVARTHTREAAVAAVAARPWEEDDRQGSSVDERGRGGWLGRPKAEAQKRVVAAAQWEGKGEWAGRGGRRGGPWLARIRSRARI
jgi:hypothetical protein